MRGHLLAALLLLGAGLAGCVNPLQPAATDDAAAPPPAPTLPRVPALPDAFEYACPPGDTRERGSGLCVGTLSSATESLQEPYVAIHPANPDVVAVGVNAGHTVGAVDPARPHPGADVALLDIYVSEDGGASWRLSQLPYAPAENGLGAADVTASGDPALAFDAEGVLHVSGILTHGVGVDGYEIFYAQSPDLGVTWSEPVVFTSDGDNDRNWLNLGPGGLVLVPWQNVGESSQLAWSVDGGDSWRVQEDAQAAADCITVSEAVVLADGTPLIACAGYGDDGPTGVQVHAFDPATGDLTLRKALPGLEGIWPQLTQTPDGALVLSVDVDGTVVLARSTDGGHTWSDAVSVRDLASVDDGWSHAVNYWLTADPWGAVHVIIGGWEWTADAGVARFLSEWRHAHVALDPVNWTLLGEQPLTAPGADDRRVPPSLAPSYGDHYFGLAFTDAGGFMAWTHDKGIDYGLVAPAWNGTAG